MPGLFKHIYERSYNYKRVPLTALQEALDGYAAGTLTRNQIMATLELEADSLPDLNAICNAIDGYFSLMVQLGFIRGRHGRTTNL